MHGVSDRLETARPAARRRGPAHVVAFTDDADFGDSLARLADGDAIPWVEVLPGGLAGALDAGAPDADIALIDIGELAEREAVDGIRGLSARGGCPVIAVGRQNDVGFYRALVAAGARDYLVVPIDEHVLADALAPRPEAPVQASPRQAAEQSTPRVNLVIGARGGVGASALAVDMAWWAAERLGVETGLLDLDLHFGACALALDLMPGRGLRDALESADRIDSLFVGSAMMNATDRLFVMAAEEDPDESIFTAPDAPARLIEALTDGFPCLVVDLPRAQVAAFADVLARADTITLVSDMTLGGLRDALRLKQLCRKRAPEASLGLVVRDAAGGKPPISRKEFERGYGDSIDWMVPHQAKLAGEAAGAGKPMAALLRKGHAHARTVAALAERCVDPAGIALPRKKRLWRK